MLLEYLCMSWVDHIPGSVQNILLGSLDGEVLFWDISKSISCSLSTAKTKMKVRISVKHGRGGGG